jgi:hypothetical protein
MADLADVFAVGAKFKQLSRGRRVGGAVGVATLEDEDVSFGIDGNTRNFAEIHVGGKLQEVGYGVKRNFGHLLRIGQRA